MIPMNLPFFDREDDVFTWELPSDFQMTRGNDHDVMVVLNASGEDLKEEELVLLAGTGAERCRTEALW